MEQITKWKNDYLDLAKHLGRKAPSVEEIGLSKLREHMTKLLTGTRHYFCCGTGINFFYVSPDGELFPCCRMLTDTKHFPAGSVFTDIDKTVVTRFKENNVINKACRSCWARYICGGQCYGDCLTVNEDIGEPVPAYCGMEKHKIEVAAYTLDDFRINGKLGEEKNNSMPGRTARMFNRIKHFVARRKILWNDEFS